MASKPEMRVKVVAIGETESIGTNGFTKRTMEGIIEGEYPEIFLFEFNKDKCALLDEVMEDTYVTVHFNIKGRKIEKDKDGLPLEKPMFFTSLNGWKITI